MRRFILSSTLVLAALAAGADVRAQQQPDVTIYRSWRPPNITVVEGMFRVDRELLGGAPCDYEVLLTVTDSAGNQLVRNQWEGRCPAAQPGMAPAALETFQFALVPSRYTIELGVQPKGNADARRTRRIELQAPVAAQRASDLVLAREVGYIDSTNVRRWTVRRGGLGLLTASSIVAEPSHPSIGYYLEVYPPQGRPLNGALYGVIRRRADDREIHRIKLQDVRDVAEPRPIAGNFSLAGLPPGEYTLEARLELGDTVIRRTHPFEMGGVAVAEQTGAARSGYFWEISEAELAELFDGVVLWLNSESERNLYQSLNAEGKREFLSRQFGRERPTPDDGTNSALDEYLARIRVVNARFEERAGRDAQQAWRTDRGRVYMMRGEPVNQVSRPAPPDGAPYEVWFYPIGSGYVYLFADDTRLGHYRLLFSNDPTQNSLPDWYRRVGAQAIEDIQRFGVRIPRIGGGGPN